MCINIYIRYVTSDKVYYTGYHFIKTEWRDFMTISSDIIRGYNDTIILSTLLSEDSYGYEISQTISEISEGKYQIKETTLYSCINRLLKNGYIESYKLDDVSMRKRVYYHITKKGFVYYYDKCKEWELTRDVINRFAKEL